ncbi:unnamed protein product [Schistosoma intercalatum]|nr:unnamed protein product [Schistosoma intercalatum]
MKQSLSHNLTMMNGVFTGDMVDFHQTNDNSSRILSTSMKRDQLECLTSNTLLNSATQLTHNHIPPFLSLRIYSRLTTVDRLKLLYTTEHLMKHAMKLNIRLQMRDFPSLPLP